MERAITGYHQDTVGDWVAELDCGHGQHVRHRPPFVERPWAATAEGRASRIGAVLDCVLCDRLAFPDHYVLHQRSPLFDQDTVPRALLKAHRTKAGVWARIHVLEGRLRYCIEAPLERAFLLDPDTQGIVLPQVPHHIEIVGAVRFFVALYTREGGEA